MHRARVRSWTLWAGALSLTLAVIAWGCGFDGLGSLVAIGDRGEPEGGTSDAGGRLDGSANANAPRYEGWTTVVVAATHPPTDAGLDVDAGVTCPIGSSSPVTYRKNGRSGPCTCTCGAMDRNPCTQGSMNHRFAENTSCNDDLLTGTTDGGCNAFPPGFVWSGANNSIDGEPLAPATVDCAASAVVPPVVDDGSTSVCTLDAMIAPPDARVCFLREGDAACPAPSLQKQTLAAVRDTRECKCTCSASAATTTCSNATIAFYTDQACTQAQKSDEVVLSGTGACTSFTTNLGGTPVRWKYSATANASCAPASATVPFDGGIDGAAFSLCCSP